MGERALFFAVGSTSAVAAGALLRWASDRLLSGRRGNHSNTGERSSRGKGSSITVLANGGKHVVGGKGSEPQTQGKPEGGISDRLARTAQPIDGLYYFMGSGEAQENPYSASNPNGLLNMSIAENSLMLDWIEPKLLACQDFSAEVLRYNGVLGMPQFREAVAATINRLLLPRDPGLVKAEHVCVCNGVSSVLDQLAYCLFDAGEAVLIPAPLYPGFLHDFGGRNRVRVIPVYTSDTVLFQPSVSDCEAAMAAAAAQGVSVRGIVLSNPTNPHGTVWPADAVRELLAWGLRQGMHVIADEVYGGSVFSEEMPEYVSAVELAERMVAGGEVSRSVVEQQLHLCYGMSKDFTLNGLRVGFLHTRNKALLQALNYVNLFSWSSQSTQAALSNMLSDTQWVDSFLSESKTRMAKQHRSICSVLEECGVPFVPCGAAMFIFIDLRSLLAEATFAAERKLWGEIKDEGRIVLVPGEACRTYAPGFFRLCFTSVRAEFLPIACERLRTFFSSRMKTTTV